MYAAGDHAGEKRTQRLHTSVFIYMKNALIQWFSKQHATIKMSVFGAEFVVMKIGLSSVPPCPKKKLLVSSYIGVCTVCL